MIASDTFTSSIVLFTMPTVAEFCGAAEYIGAKKIWSNKIYSTIDYISITHYENGFLFPGTEYGSNHENHERKSLCYVLRSNYFQIIFWRKKRPRICQPIRQFNSILIWYAFLQDELLML